jgi:hypothetical protein
MRFKRSDLFKAAKTDELGFELWLSYSQLENPRSCRLQDSCLSDEHPADLAQQSLGTSS